MKEKTQIEKVLSKLQINGTWICGTEFQKEFIPTYSQRISELRKKGWEIESDICNRTTHSHKGSVAMYRLHDHNGWKNYETWNVALWITSDENLYNIAKNCLNYSQFVGIIANTTDEKLMRYKYGTPDGVPYNTFKVISEDLDELIKELS